MSLSKGRDVLLEFAERYGKSPYGQHLRAVAESRYYSMVGRE